MSYKKLMSRLYLHFSPCALNLLHGLSVRAFPQELCPLLFFPSFWVSVQVGRCSGFPSIHSLAFTLQGCGGVLSLTFTFFYNSLMVVPDLNHQGHRLEVPAHAGSILPVSINTLCGCAGFVSVGEQNVPHWHVSLWHVNYFSLIIFKKQKTLESFFSFCFHLTPQKNLDRGLVPGKELSSQKVTL